MGFLEELKGMVADPATPVDRFVQKASQVEKQLSSKSPQFARLWSYILDVIAEKDVEKAVKVASKAIRKSFEIANSRYTRKLASSCVLKHLDALSKKNLKKTVEAACLVVNASATGSSNSKKSLSYILTRIDSWIKKDPENAIDAVEVLIDNSANSKRLEKSAIASWNKCIDKLAKKDLDQAIKKACDIARHSTASKGKGAQEAVLFSILKHADVLAKKDPQEAFEVAVLVRNCSDGYPEINSKALAGIRKFHDKIKKEPSIPLAPSSQIKRFLQQAVGAKK